jgi:hypothetical protein
VAGRTCSVLSPSAIEVADEISGCVKAKRVQVVQKIKSRKVRSNKVAVRIEVFSDYL